MSLLKVRVRRVSEVSEYDTVLVSAFIGHHVNAGIEARSSATKMALLLQI
jgi:hypothetical protein